jgi:phosphoglycolate phosphatase
MKLRAVGIDPGLFAVSVWGDEAPTRPGLVRVAFGKYAALRGRSIDPGRVILVGDTPRDVEAAVTNGCVSVGVATGKYSMDALRHAGAHLVLKDLTDPSPIERVLANGRG